MNITLRNSKNIHLSFYSLSSIFYFLFFLLSTSTTFPQTFPIGHRTMNFVDPARNNRPVPSEVYYPAVAAGNNTSVANGAFPVIVFGHGFVMTVSAYNYFKDAMVPLGYYVVLPTTEGGISPNHADYGADLAFLVQQMQLEGNTTSSPFYQHVDSTSAVMGHSMGGGASFLACKNNTLPTVMVTFAAAETNPSAIAAAADIILPNLVISADQDCVTPPAQHQIPMYNALASDCKVFLNIIGGGHCYFADYNFQCSLGEVGCQQNFTITREEQHAVTLDFTKLYFDYYLKRNASSWTTFNDSLTSSSRITYEKSCVTSDLENPSNQKEMRIFPNPVTDLLQIKFPIDPGKVVELNIYRLDGVRVINETLPVINQGASIYIGGLNEGCYILEISGQKGFRYHAIILHNFEFHNL